MPSAAVLLAPTSHPGMIAGPGVPNVTIGGLPVDRLLVLGAYFRALGDCLREAVRSQQLQAERFADVHVIAWRKAERSRLPVARDLDVGALVGAVRH